MNPTPPVRPTDLTRLERGRPLTDDEIAEFLADRQTSIRHGTAWVATEIAEQLRDRHRALREAAVEMHRLIFPTGKPGHHELGSDPVCHWCRADLGDAS